FGGVHVAGARPKAPRSSTPCVHASSEASTLQAVEPSPLGRSLGVSTPLRRRPRCRVNSLPGRRGLSGCPRLFGGVHVADRSNTSSPAHIFRRMSPAGKKSPCLFAVFKPRPCRTAPAAPTA